MSSHSFDKVIFLLRKYYDNDRDRKWLREIVVHSEFEFTDHWNQRSIPNLYNLQIKTDHDLLIKRLDSKESICEIIKSDILKLADIWIDKVALFPDYNKVQIVRGELKPIYTSHDSINLGQQKLLDQLEKATDSDDFRNIGNSSRSLLEKLAEEVFDPSIHTPQDSDNDVRQGKFKNQLHAYIRHELGGAKNQVLRNFAESAIETVERSIDLSNKLTHKIKAKRTIAEFCIVATISAVSIINLVESKIE
ncbi:MAG: hypothetical protein K8R35_05570 [Bacteroidales bacterium]|nr:hypothetical protein [Bacteroidales bacterium]